MPYRGRTGPLAAGHVLSLAGRTGFERGTLGGPYSWEKRQLQLGSIYLSFGDFWEAVRHPERTVSGL
jgi:hypothetical protein